MQENFLKLSFQESALSNLQEALDLKYKLTLLIGKSGSGKTMLLQGLLQQNQSQKIALFTEPFSEELNFIKAFENVFFPNKKLSSFVELNALLKKDARHYTLLLDEFDLYAQPLWDKIRVLSDLPNISLVCTLHKRHKFIEQEHFASRISKEILLKKLDFARLRSYLKEKHDSELKFFELYFLLKKTRQNLRLVDTLMKSFHFLRFEYQGRKSTKTLLEMSALYHRLV